MGFSKPRQHFLCYREHLLPCGNALQYVQDQIGVLVEPEKNAPTKRWIEQEKIEPMVSHIQVFQTDIGYSQADDWLSGVPPIPTKGEK
jgi:hypothetical protein